MSTHRSERMAHNAELTGQRSAACRSLLPDAKFSRHCCLRCPGALPDLNVAVSEIDEQSSDGLKANKVRGAENKWGQNLGHRGAKGCPVGEPTPRSAARRDPVY